MGNTNECNFKFSVIMPIYNVEKYLEESILSVVNQTIGFKDNIQLILVNDGSPDNSGLICEKYKKMYPDNVVYVKQENAGVSSARNHGIEFVKGRYINFLDSDDKWELNAFERVWEFFEENYSEIDIASVKMECFEATDKPHVLNFKFKKDSDYVADILSANSCNAIQLHVTSSFLKSNAVIKSNAVFDSEVKYGEDSLFINRFVITKGRIGYVASTTHYYRKRLDQSSAVQTQKLKTDYYSVSPKKHYYGLIELSKSLYGCVIDYVQNILAYDIGWRMVSPVPDVIKNNSELYDEYCSMLKELLGYVEDVHIFNSKVHRPIERKRALYNMKHSGDLFKDLKYIPLQKSYVINGYRFLKLEKCKSLLKIECVEIKNDKLYVAGVVSKWIFDCTEDTKLLLKFGDKFYKTVLKKYDNVSAENFFGTDDRFYYFEKSITLAPSDFDENFQIKLKPYIAVGKTKQRIFMKYGRNIATRLNFGRSYTLFGNYYVVCKEHIVSVFKPDNIKKKHIENEKECLKWLWNKGHKDVAKIRMKSHFFKKTKFKNQRIWLISDRILNGGDNGEVFFKYLTKLKPKGIRPIFVISEKADCLSRLKSEGEVICFEDKMYPYYFLAAEKIISSSANELTLNPFGENRRFLIDLFKYKFYFLQHGVTSADLSAWLNKFNKNIEKIIVSSKLEQDSFLNADYIYKKRNIALTGMARFDELVDKKEKLVVIMPTWRRSIKGSYDENTTSVYYDRFKETEYFKYYNNLINDEKLLEVMRKKGYKGLFCIHPIHMEQSIDFNENDVFEIDKGYVDYKDVFSKAALIVTDYSSVHFDVAYMKKSIIYTQFDKKSFFEGQIYDQGYFDYDNIGFGPVCYDYDSTVKAMVNCVDSDCAPSRKYIERIENFFEYIDRNNCERIYKAITK